MTSATVVVTGGAGFIGRHVCRELGRRRCRVVGIGHRSTAHEWADASWGVAKWREADLSIAALESLVHGEAPAALVHCAGTGAVSRSYAAPYEDFCCSALTTAMVLEFVRQRFGDATRVVLISSAAVYGDQGECDLSEDSPRRPISPYGFSKVAAEDLCDAYCRFFGMTASIVRLFSVYGEGLRKQLLWDAMGKLSNGNLRFFGTGREMRDWIHVEDAAALICDAALTPQDPFEIYNGGNSKAATREVIEKLAGSADTAATPDFTGEAHPGNPGRLTSDSARAQQRLGWQPRITLEEGLARYVRWFRSEAKA